MRQTTHHVTLPEGRRDGVRERSYATEESRTRLGRDTCTERKYGVLRGNERPSHRPEGGVPSGA